MEGIKVKLLSFAHAVGFNKEGKETTNKEMKQLVFHQLGTRKTITINFFLKDLSKAQISKRIWVNNIARQLELELDLADEKYFEKVEGKSKTQAVQLVDKELDQALTSFVGKEVEIYLVMVQKAGKTYFNYQPYAPAEVATNTAGFEPAKLKKAE